MVEKKKTSKVGALDEKSLFIRLVDRGGPPEFVFEGTWAGKDVRVILRHVSQAYRRHQIATAKAMAIVQEKLEKVGASNE